MSVCSWLHTAYGPEECRGWFKIVGFKNESGQDRATVVSNEGGELGIVG